MNAGPAWVDGARAGVGGFDRTARREWAAGWMRSARCPVDPGADATPGRRGWRSFSGAPLTDDWMARHAQRRDAVRQLRRAGYHARRWQVDAGHYVSGPCAGRRVVDPWTTARELDACGARWLLTLRLRGGALAGAPVPLPCGRVHVCPVCAGARARLNAAAVRDRWTAARAAGAETALVTLTQRVDPAETMTAALDRLEAGLKLLRRSKRWQATAAGAWVGREVTYRPGRGWHAHAHAVVVLHATRRVDGWKEQRATIGRAWVEASAAAADAAGRPGYGWAPAAGGCVTRADRRPAPALEGMTARTLRRWATSARAPAWARVAGAHRLRVGELRRRMLEGWARRPRVVVLWAGPWFQRLEDDRQVGQAAKYVTPFVSGLPPAALAEFVTAARGRRFSSAWGTMRAAAAAAAAAADAGEGAHAADDAGELLSILQPGAGPDVDQLAPVLGWQTPDPAAVAHAAPAPAVVAWRVRLDVAWRPDVMAAAAAGGLWWALGPRRLDWSMPTAGLRPAGVGEAPDEGQALYLAGPADTARAWVIGPGPAAPSMPRSARRVDRTRRLPPPPP